MKTITSLLLVILWLINPANDIQAQGWKFQQKIDSFTGDNISISSIVAPKRVYGGDEFLENSGVMKRLLLMCSDGKIWLAVQFTETTFLVFETPEVLFKIDANPTIRIDNRNRTGWKVNSSANVVVTPIWSTGQVNEPQIINELKTGNFVRIRIPNGNNTFEGAFALRGSTSAINKIINSCIMK